MKSVIGKCLFGLGVGFFCGYVIIAVGLGSVCASLYKVAAPIVCSEDQSLEVVKHRHSWRPGATMWTATVYRVDRKTGRKTDCTTLAKLVSGAIYGLGIFVLLLPRICRKTARPVAERAPGAPDESPPACSADEGSAELK